MGVNLFKNKELPSGVFRKACSIAYELHGLSRRHYLDLEKPVTVGRSDTCDICIHHHEVEPVHCRFERTSDGKVLVFAESASSPVHINGYATEFSTITSKDQIRVGPVTLTVSDKVFVQFNGDLPEPVKRYGSSFGPVLMQSIRRSHWFAASLLIHLALILFLYNVEEKKGAKQEYRGFVQDFVEDGSPVADLWDESDPEPPDPEPEEIEPLDPLLAEVAYLEPNPIFSMYNPDQSLDALTEGRMLDSTGSPVSKGSGGRVLSYHTRRKEADGLKIGWKRLKTRLGASGMDIAVLFDSTGSMSGFISEVKSTIEEMIHVMQAIVPDTTLSLITYKGDVVSSDYVVNGTPLVGDAYELLNFIRTVRVSGGSAEGYAAISTALHSSVSSLSWRDGTEKVIVLIGDAPPFPGDRRKCLESVGQFNGKVATIYKASSGETAELEAETKSIFRQIAKAGEGPFLLYDSEGNVVKRIVSAVLGVEWESHIEEAFRQKRSGLWRKRVERKVRAGNLSWLLQQFEKPQVKPEIIEALIDWGNPYVALDMWRLLRASKGKSHIVQRALYVLWHIAKVDIPYDPAQRNYLTKAQQLYVTVVLRKVFGEEFLSKK